MIEEDYVSFEIAKLLKERGFSEWCFKCYGVAVLHNGVDISFDEECELKDEGRENEIEYVEGRILYDYGCNNRDKDVKVWAAPTLWVAMKWLREVFNINIEIIIYWTKDKSMVYGNRIVHNGAVLKEIDTAYNSYEQACEKAIKYCLEKLI